MVFLLEIVVQLSTVHILGSVNSRVSFNFCLHVVLHSLYRSLNCLQMAKALQFIHDRGLAHMDVKPENIYAKNGVYKIGDFGCAPLVDKSLPSEEGDSRYMP